MLTNRMLSPKGLMKYPSNEGKYREKKRDFPLVSLSSWNRGKETGGIVRRKKFQEYGNI